jgi:hypothetical protein
MASASQPLSAKKTRENVRKQGEFLVKAGHTLVSQGEALAALQGEHRDLETRLALAEDALEAFLRLDFLGRLAWLIFGPR